MNENHSDNIAIIINHHDECSQDNTAPAMAAEMAPKENADNQIDQSQTVNINLNGDEVQNGNVSPLKGASDEFSQKLIIEKIENLNLENHELKAENGEFKSKIDHLEKICSQLKTKSERSSAQIESSKRELQSMVIKYATSEREVINLKKHYTETERKCKDLLKDKELLQTQIKQLNNEKKQLTTNVEKRVLESVSLQNENELLKNKLEQADVKIQQLQVQLAQVNGQFKIANEKLNRIESGLGKFNLNVNSESISENSVDQINEERSDDDQSEGVDEAKDKTNCTDQFLKCVEENGLLIKQIEQLESQNVDYQNKIAELDLKLSDANLEVADYQRKVQLIESLKQELINKQTAIEELKHQFDRINSINRDLVGDIDSSKHKEAELLEYTERLTAKLVSLQSEHNNLNEKLKSTQQQADQFKSNLDQILVEKDEIKSKYDALKTGTDQQIKELTDQLDVKISESNELHQKIDQLENDIKIIKRRHILNLKELNKEIQSLKKQRELDPPNMKLNQQQRPQTQLTNETANSSTLSSRTSSFNSLSELSNNVVDTSHSVPTTELAFNSGHRTNPNASNGNSDTSAPTAIPSTLTSSSSSTLSAANNNCQSSATTTSSSSSTSELITSLNDIDKTVLVERILRLQRTLIKRNEKVDFLEEHNEQLTEEVRKKSKLLQYYILKEESGALATETMDKNKAYISKRGGGIMSSLYNSSSTDDSMTLERSLEINNKLHAVLEDTLLKNMTLKENLNTLAQEIDRLSKSKK